MFYRLEIKVQMFYSESYLRPKKRNSFTVCFNCSSSRKNFGHILKFISVPDYGVFSVVRLLTPTLLPSEAFDLSESAMDYSCRVFPVQLSDTLQLVPIEDLVSKCLFIHFPSENLCYIALMNTDILLD